MPTPTVPLRRGFNRQENPTNDKVGVRSGYAGASAASLVLQEFSGRVVVDLGPGENMISIHAIPEVGTPVVIAWEYLPGLNAEGGRRAWGFVTYPSLASSAAALRHYVLVTTSRGVTRRQVWLGTGGGLYVGRPGGKCFDCTQVCVHLYADTGGVGTMGTLDVNFSLNIVPYANDEFFRGGELTQNRYCNTIRNHGGALTGVVWVDYDEVIPETDVLDIHGVYLVAPAAGYHQLTVRLRPEWGSRHYKDLVGLIQVRHMPGAEAPEGCEVYGETPP